MSVLLARGIPIDQLPSLEFVVRWRRRFVDVPMPLVTGHRNMVDPDGDLWLSVLEATGQPATLGR